MKYRRPDRFRVQARQQGNGFIGVFAMPGRPETFIRDEQDQVRLFANELEAIAAAGEGLMHALNNRVLNSRSLHYKRMTGAELAVALADIGIQPVEFARIWGTKQARVMGWIDGAEDIPHAARILCALLSMPGGLQIARQMTASVIITEQNDGAPKEVA